MSSIQEAMARIQEIMDRIRAIQNLEKGPSRAEGPVNQPTGATATRGEVVASPAGGASSPVDFAKLLEQALGSQAEPSGSTPNAGATAAGLLSGGAPQSTLDSLLGLGQLTGTDAAGSSALTDFSEALRSYQSTLIQAVRQLAAEQAPPNPPPNAVSGSPAEDRP